jgi:hypothetical protein
MRTLAALVALAAAATLIAPAAISAPSAAAVALHAGDWHRAGELGASAADVVRALQARGQFTDMVAAESVVTIGADNSVSVVPLKPLPPLSAGDTGNAASTASLSGTGFAFTAKAGAIILYPAYAQASFAPAGSHRP